MKKIHLLLLSLLSGVILALAWPERGFAGLLFTGFVPLLMIEDYILQHPEKFRKLSALLYSYPAFITWNSLTTWWICNSTGIGAVVAIAVNSLFMSIVFSLFHFTRKQLKNDVAGFAALVLYWIAFEYIHLNWDLNWPWLNLGNGFGAYYKWVQWYEYTGTLGGTCWVLVANILLFYIVRPLFSPPVDRPKTAARNGFILAFVAWVIVPVIFSYIRYSSYREEIHPVKVVLVQPNIDPYSEQYVLPPKQVVGRIMKLATPFLDSTTNFLVAPESAIQEEMWENEINTFQSIRLLKEITHEYPCINILIGGSTFRYFNKGEEVSITARQFTDTKGYYDAYNTAILFNSTDSLQLYHKSKLTPGVEILPSFRNFKWFEKFAINLGGTVGSLGTDDVRKVFKTVKTVGVSPAICYESIFGEFFSEFARNGAQVMFIITNDGWWGNTAGHRQHLVFASLRAIETRRCIGRSANTGISGFINQRGDILDRTSYWQPAVIKGTLNASSYLTFYTVHGDWIARAALFPGGLLFMLGILFRFAYRRNERK